MKAVILGKAMSSERVARTSGDREREKNRKATPEINGSSFVPPYASSRHAKSNPGPSPPRAHENLKTNHIRVSRHRRASTSRMSQRCGLVIVIAKYKTEGKGRMGLFHFYYFWRTSSCESEQVLKSKRI